MSRIQWIPVQRGDLKSRALSRTLLTDISLMGEDIPLKSVQIITLKQWLYDNAVEQAWTQCIDYTKIQQLINQQIKQHYNCGRQFVEVANNQIQVCVNANVVDEQAMAQAALFLLQVQDLITPATYYFGEVIDIYDKS